MKSSFMNFVRVTGQKAKAAVAHQIGMGVASFSTPGAQLSNSDRRIFSALMLSAAVAHTATAQSVATTQAAVTSLKSLVFTVAQGIFAVFLVIALVKVAKKFMGGEPDAMTSLMWLVGGVLVFFGFSALKTSLVGGGSAGGGTADGLLGQ